MPSIPRKEHAKFTPDVVERYLAQLRACGRHAESAHAAGISPNVIRIHQRDDPNFFQQCQEATAEYIESIDREVARRGVEGYDRIIYYQGVMIGTERVYSDALLLAHAKAHHPAYGDRSKVEMQVSAAPALGLSELSDEDRAALRELLRKRAGS